MRLHEKLVHLRKKKGLSQIELAEMLQVSRQAISRWEVGSSMPSTDNLKYISELYDVSVDILLDNSAELELPTSDSTENTKAKALNWSRQKTVIVILCGFILTALICFAMTSKKENVETAIPIEDMLFDEGDTLPSEDFTIDFMEW